MPEAAAPFVDNGDGTITDTSTGLMWDKCARGQSGLTCATGASLQYTWANALTEAATQSGVNYKTHAD